MSAPTSPSVTRPAMNFTPAKGFLRLEDADGTVVQVTVKAETAWTCAAALRAIGAQLEETLEAREGNDR